VCIGVVLAAAIVAVAAWSASSRSDAVSAAEAQFMRGDLTGAEASYEAILAKTPGDARALDGLAVVLVGQQKYEQAAAIQERAASADKTNMQVRVELGFNYLNHLGRAQDAVRAFEEAVSLDGSAKNLTFLAQAQNADGLVSDAEDSLRHAIDADPQYPHSYLVLINLLEQQHRSGDADQIRRLAGANGAALESVQTSQTSQK
jgi:tetratricopeptide (TPR) repeat protein